MTTVREDVLGSPYTAETIPLPDDEEGAVVATLVRHTGGPGAGRAVLHVHGFVDYFFQTAYAEWWTARGYDFYALDLRKYGRSLRPHHTPHYVEDLAEHYPELDAAWQRITERDGHDHVVLSAHSTGGLIVPLWLADHAVPAAGQFLNAPWFDLQGAWWMRTIGTQLIRQVGPRVPRKEIPREVNGVYGRSLHRDHGGEFDFNLEWKPLESRPVYVGWLRAIREGHARLHAGLDLAVPTLVLASDRTTTPTELDEDAHSSDIVLDVRQIRRWASSVGTHVTSIAVPGARHDVVLSRAPVLKQVHAELERWLTAYVDPR
ncbi:alpha/beta hydrolase [Nocardioides sp. AE5]|uniref:alpha/beta hydrolase n=1 Tax=Nocardioides sp. AE5 TaxID=2962573 RepID=UPI0028811911|nr:alpha/beta hydrolase [Nocardioides sp. AE5]MDT0203601.1 alpha/beta hydrolase [Nocardioides sp. AE5]